MKFSVGQQKQQQQRAADSAAAAAHCITAVKQLLQLLRVSLARAPVVQQGGKHRALPSVPFQGTNAAGRRQRVTRRH